MHAYITGYLNETSEIVRQLLDGQVDNINKVIDLVIATKESQGRVFFVGVGGAAGTGSHSANDFNKIAEVSSFCLTDNPSLLTALANDEGAESVFARQMEMHHFDSNDLLFVYSVGGGSDTTSRNLVLAIDLAHKLGAKVAGVVGKPDGYTAKFGDAVIVIPIIHKDRITPHSESFGLAMDHLIVNAIAKNGRWENGD